MSDFEKQNKKSAEEARNFSRNQKIPVVIWHEPSGRMRYASSDSPSKPWGHDDDSVIHETGGHRAHEGDHTPDSRVHPGANLEAQSDD